MLLLDEQTAIAFAVEADRLVRDDPVSAKVIMEAKKVAESCDLISRLAEHLNAIVAEQGYAQLRALPTANGPAIILAIGNLLSEPFVDPAEGSAIVSSHVRPRQPIMGNQLRHLPLHTDYSMMLRPPRLTISFCIRPDPVPGNGSLMVTDVESTLFGMELAVANHAFRRVQLPFAARNVSNDTDVIHRPIIEDTSSDEFIVRYHRSRIAQGFKHLNLSPSEEQIATMRHFEDLALRNSELLPVYAGDLTIIDNHRMLHGRSRCSVQVHNDGSTDGRQMMFLFGY